LNNILLDSKGNAVISDFFFCKRLKIGEKAYSNCGTLEYSAPEIFKDFGYSFEVDHWALGVTVYHMLKFPKFPFKKKEKILNEEFPDLNEISNNESKIIEKKENIIDEVTCNFVSKLLTKDPNKRLGSIHNLEEIREHQFFSSINWIDLENGQVIPPITPKKVIFIY